MVYLENETLRNKKLAEVSVMKINKQELITAISIKANLSKKHAAAALTALTDVITEALKAEGKLAIPSLGTFLLQI